MARQAQVRGRPGRARRQPTNWTRSMATGPTTVAAGTKALIATIALSNPGIGETIRRTRGIVLFTSDQNTDEDYNGALGFIVVNDLAIAAGAGSIPGPVTEASDDGWFVWQPLAGRFETNEQAYPPPYMIDSKAMRRVEEGFTVAVMAENSHVTFGMDVTCGFSVLSSLS